MRIARRIDSAIVLGATGFIGNYLVEALIKENVRVIAVVRKESLNRFRMLDNELVKLLFIEEDIVETLQTMEILQNSVCFNLLWKGVAGNERKDYNLQLDNVRTALDVMHILSEKECRVFVGASSISECDAALYGNIDGIKLPGRYMYATAKLAMNYMCRIESRLLGVSYINAIIGNVYGESGDDNLLLHSTIIKLLKHEETSFTEATQWYDFVYIKDVARALILLAYHGEDAVSYYIGSGKIKPLKEYLTDIGEKIDRDAVLGFGKIENDGYSIPKETFNISKIMKDTGYCPENDFEKNIDSVIAYYRKELEE